MSWWSRSWLPGPSTVTDQLITSFPPTSSVVPTTVAPNATRDGPSDNQTSRDQATASDWVVVTEIPEQKPQTPEPKAFVSTESFSGEGRVPETEGSSWGDTYPSSQTPLTVEITSTGSFSTAAHGLEARGEIQYRRRNKPKRLNQSTTEMTPSMTTPAAVMSSTGDTATTLSTSTDQTQTSSFTGDTATTLSTSTDQTQTSSSTGDTATTLSTSTDQTQTSSSTGDTATTLSTSTDQTQTSSFITTVPSGVEPDLSSTEAVRKNSSTGEDGN